MQYIASTVGGGVLNLSTMTLIDSVAQVGGGIATIGVILTLINSTVSDNSATNNGTKEEPDGDAGLSSMSVRLL